MKVALKMPNNSKIRKILKETTNIAENISDTDEDGYNLVNERAEEDGGSDSENSFIVRRRKLRSIRLSSSSDDSDLEFPTDGTNWVDITGKSFPGRMSENIIFRASNGPTAHAKRNIIKGNVSSAFLLIMNHRIIDYIIKCTKLEAARVLGKEWDFSQQKFYNFIAILYARAAYEARNLKLSYLWSEKWGPTFFKKTLSRNDFTEILRFIRFDKRNERSQRLKTNKFALVSTVWDAFIENSQNCFVPGQNITVDEQLFSTKARCRFTQYMPNKPDKLEIKIWLACDVNSKYVINGFPYLGKNETRHLQMPLSEFVVLKLIEPFIGAGRNVTTDNYFTSKSLASKLLEQRTTLVGTIRSNKKDLPELAKQKEDSLARCV